MSMEKANLIWQRATMIPSPFLALLRPDHGPAAIPSGVSAVILSDDPGPQTPAWQAAADRAEVALIRTVSADDDGADGFWTPQLDLLKALRARSRDLQLVGLAQDRHGAMELAEAGADLILFAAFDPVHAAPQLLPGEEALARWWAIMFEVPCALLRDMRPDPAEGYGGEGMPEFFLVSKEASHERGLSGA